MGNSLKINENKALNALNFENKALNALDFPANYCKKLWHKNYEIFLKFYVGIIIYKSARKIYNKVFSLEDNIMVENYAKIT